MCFVIKFFTALREENIYFENVYVIFLTLCLRKSILLKIKRHCTKSVNYETNTF